MKIRPVTLTRRQSVMSVLAAGSAAFCSAAFGRLAGSAQGNAQAAPSTSAGDAVDDALRADLARLGSPAYSDEGIPVFLSCANVAGERVGAPRAAVTPFNETTAAEIHKNAEAWQRIFPNAPDTDISKLIEVLAERDFNRARSGDAP